MHTMYIIESDLYASSCVSRMCFCFVENVPVSGFTVISRSAKIIKITHHSYSLYVVRSTWNSVRRFSW